MFYRIVVSKLNENRNEIIDIYDTDGCWIEN